MLTVTYRKHGIRFSHVWFATNEEIKSGEFRKNTGDLIFLHGIDESLDEIPKGGVLYTKQNTFLKDLTMSEEELFQTLGKHCRKHIRKCERENETDIKIYESKEILNNREILSVCKFLFEKMFADKGISNKFNTKLALKYCKKNALTIFMSYVDNEPVGFSAVIFDKNNSRAWVGAFDYRNNDKDGYVLSRAHRLLNWKRLTWSKENGISSFDFGGIVSFENPDAKGKFKLDFGAENPVTYLNYLVPNNFIGKAALKFFFRK